jgi:hypothetical protein
MLNIGGDHRLSTERLNIFRPRRTCDLNVFSFLDWYYIEDAEIRNRDRVFLFQPLRNPDEPEFFRTGRITSNKKSHYLGGPAIPNALQK